MDGQQSLMRLSCQLLLYCAFLLCGCQDHKVATVTSAAALQAQWQQLAVSTDQELSHNNGKGSAADRAVALLVCCLPR